MSRRASLQDALDRLDSEDLGTSYAVRHTYDRYVGGGPAAKPSDEAARRAVELLGRVRADV